MIFITTGSTALSSSMQDVIIEIDKAKGEGIIKEDVIAQIGEIEYKPQFIDLFFKFTNEFDKYINEADLIITADGAGTIFELLKKNKKVIVVVNPAAQKYGASANDFVGKLYDEKYLIWCKDVSNIANCILEAKEFNFKEYKSPECKIAETIIENYNKWLDK